jgi:hypothetical protein
LVHHRIIPLHTFASPQTEAQISSDPKSCKAGDINHEFVPFANYPDQPFFEERYVAAYYAAN